MNKKITALLVLLIYSALVVHGASAAITYVDATPNTDGSNGNTTIDGALVTFGTNATDHSHSGTDGLWDRRSYAAANGGTIWQTADDEVATEPLITSIDLAPGLYDVYGIYTSQLTTNANPTWMASFSIDGGNNYTDWTGAGTNPQWPNSGTPVDSANYTSTVSEQLNSNIQQYQAYLGQVNVTDTLTVYVNTRAVVDTLPGAADDRTWYDGIGYEYVSEPPTPTGSVVTIDPDGTAVVNDERTFIIGAFRDPSDAWLEFDNVKNAGFNLVHNYRFESQIPASYTSGHVSTWINDAQNYLTAAENSGLGVFMGLPRSVVDAQDNTNLALIVNSLKTYDALWFWYLYDEPGMLSNVSDVSNAYNIVKQNDSYHPTVFADYGKRLIYYDPMANYVDVPWIDRYGIPYDTFEILRDMQGVKNAYPDKPVWAVPQGFDHQFQQHQKFETEEGYSPYPSSPKFNDENTTQSPKAIESQANATLSLEGMQGIIYYWQPHTWHNIMDTPAVWQGIRSTTNQLKALNNALISQEDTSDITITHSGWGTEDRIDELYGFKVPSNLYPANEHVAYWKRKLDGSVYVGATTTYVPRQLVTIDLPFEFARVIKYPSQKTVIRKVDGQDPQIYQYNSDIMIWNVPDGNTVSLILNDIDSAVLRFDPVDPTETFSYSQNFTGTNGSTPADWSSFGTIDIQGNALVAQGGSGVAESYYIGPERQDWEDYELTGYIKQSYAFSTTASTESSYCTGISFKVQDHLNYYVASVKKKAGSMYPSLVISKVSDGVLTDIAFEPVSATWNTSSWYIFELEVYGSYFKFSIAPFGGSTIGSVDAVDTDYKYGPVGAHSELPSGHKSYYENYYVEGRKLLPNGECLLAIAAGDLDVLEYDLDEDCYVSHSDLAIIAENWLGCIDDDCQIDLSYLSAFASDWLQCNDPANDGCVD